MATRTRRNRSTAQASEPEAKAKSNGGTERRTHEDILDLVPAIVKKLKDGATMTEIRGEYGAGPMIRKALAEKGYNTKGEKLEVEEIDSESLTDKQLAKAIAELREDGKAWWYISLATDLSEDECKEILEDNGYEKLAAGRVAAPAKEEEPEPEPEKKTRSRSRTRGAKAETKEEPEETTTTRRRRRRSSEDPSA